jgi:hypothetical protein
MPFLYLGNIPNCSSSISHIVGIVICHAVVFRPNNDSERTCTPDAPVDFPNSGASLPSPRIPRSISPEPFLHAEESQESQSEIPVQAPTLVDTSPAGFRSKVTTQAAIEASKSRRKSPSKYFCKYCRQGFTRKSNLDREPWLLPIFGSHFHVEAHIEHYQSHLGVPNKLCPFCRQMFMGSINRHKKSCKQNPDRQSANRQLEVQPKLEPSDHKL